MKPPGLPVRWARALSLIGNSAIDARLDRWQQAFDRGAEPRDERRRPRERRARPEAPRQRRAAVDHAHGEVDALRAQIADLQAKLADTRAGAIDPLGPMKKFRVEVKDAPTWIVEAPHATLAWGAYCTAVGVNNSQYTPSIVEVDLATELGRV